MKNKWWEIPAGILFGGIIISAFYYVDTYPNSPLTYLLKIVGLFIGTAFLIVYLASLIYAMYFQARNDTRKQKGTNLNLILRFGRYLFSGVAWIFIMWLLYDIFNPAEDSFLDTFIPIISAIIVILANVCISKISKWLKKPVV